MYFSCTTIRRSVTTSATLLIPKCTTRRWTLRRSNHSVAKRQQFSCALSTATLSLSLKMWFQRVGFDFSRSMSKYYFYCCTGTYEHELWYFCFVFRVRPGRNKHVAYDTYRGFCRFLGHSTQTDCGSCSFDSKCNTLQNIPWLCASILGGFLRDIIVLFQRDICREHSLIGRRNCLMTEAANSHSAGAGPALSTTKNPIANLDSD